MSRFYVTTPIYYVNDVPHLGHAYTTIAADASARWHRLLGHEVRFLTGTDEHGQKVLRAADKLGRSPQEHADLLHVRYKDLWVRLLIDYDDFIRTTEPRHQAVVRAALARLHANGEIYSADYSGWYSTSAERFWTEDELVDGKCPDTGQPVEWITERNYFFKMGAYQERLVRWIQDHPDCIRPESRKNEVLGYLKQPLGDLCISRPKARLPWGIPLPFAEDYVTYVWFDALTNYVSALGDDVATWWPHAHHLVGKDILTFHTVYWFSMLFAMGLEPPKSVYAHGWWTVEGQKMSKSIGNVVDPHLLVDAYGADAVRYFVLREIPFGTDGDFSHQAFLTRYNADLANDLGNLAHRALTMTEKWLDGRVRAADEERPADTAFREVGERACAAFAAQIEQFQFRQALEALWEFVRAGNKYLDTEAPWSRVKEGDHARAGAVLRNALECVRIAASHLWCVCPSKCDALLGKLSQAAPNLSTRFDVLPGGLPIASGEPLFPRLAELPPAIAAQLEAVNAAKAEAAATKAAEKAAQKAAQKAKAQKAAGAPTAPAAPATTDTVAPASPSSTTPEKPVSETPPPAGAPAETVPQIEYDDFAKVALRVGLVVSAERHPNADKLLLLKVDVGEAEPRTILAGIADRYAPEDVQGKRIVVVANLKPRKMRGIESHGMLLAAGPDAALLTTLKDVPPGTAIK